MDTVLVILGILGFGAIIVSAYVFTVAARDYVNDDEQQAVPNSYRNNPHTERSNADRRRSNNVVQFPLALGGVIITADRRVANRRTA